MSGILAATVGGGIGELVINITNTANPNIPALVTAAGWLGTMQKIRIVSTGNVNTLDIPAGALNGADITLDLSSASFIGGTYNGGTALKTRVNIKVRNLGTLAGGGGRGGDGEYGWVSRTLQNGAFQYASGSSGVGGRGQGFAAGALTVLASTAGAAGTSGSLAPTGDFGGGGGGGRGSAYAYGGRGGDGGGWGANGGAGENGGYSGDYDKSGVGGPTGGQLGGYYIDGNSFVTWLATGTRIGRAA